jgi:sugar phosphate isomerase/epimerase
MRIGYNTWSMATVPYQSFIPGLSDVGFRAIAISVVPGYTIGGAFVENAAALDGMTADDRKAIKNTFEERDLELPSIIGNQSLVEDDPQKHALSMRRLKNAIDLCVELTPRGQDVPTLNTGLAGHTGDLERKREVVLERLGELAEYAQQRGVIVCIEPHVGGAVDTIERAEYIVKAVNKPSLRLDFDVSHFEVVGVPTEESVPRLLPLAAAAEIKDQHMRYADSGEAPAGWLAEGNGVGRGTDPNGREVEFQFLLAGEGTFDLPKYLRLVQQCGFQKPIAFEASVQCQARPGYDALREATRIFSWMQQGWRRAGVSEE